MSPAPKPLLTFHWVLEDVETDEPRVTHYFQRYFGRSLQWPVLGDRVLAPPGIDAGSPDGTMGGKVTDVVWSHDLNDVEVWAYAHAHEVDDDSISAAQEAGWDYGSVSLSGEGADDY